MKCCKIIPINTAELSEVMGAKGKCECWGSGVVLETIFGHYNKVVDDFHACEQWCINSIGGKFWVFQDFHGQTWVSKSATHFLPTQHPYYGAEKKYC